MKPVLKDRLLWRELGHPSRHTAVKGLYGDRSLVDNLDIVNELGGHSGCVNALRYSTISFEAMQSCAENDYIAGLHPEDYWHLGVTINISTYIPISPSRRLPNSLSILLSRPATRRTYSPSNSCPILTTGQS